MDSLMVALVAGLALGIGDRTSWLAAMLADRGRSPLAVIAAAALASGVGNAIAAQVGTMMPRTSPNATALLLAIALGFAGAGALWGARRPERQLGWPPLLAFLALGAGEGMHFVTFALANRAAAAQPFGPALAAIGATVGTLAAVTTATLLGERAWLKLPRRAIRMTVGAILLIVAIVLALGALRLR